MRLLPSIAVAAVAVATTVAFTPSAFASAPGDNGTVKIHDAKTGTELIKDDSHVCTFYLDAFKFDKNQSADWKIVDQPPTGTEDVVAAHGAFTLDADGNGHTDDMTLANGHYKLVWNFDTEHGNAKHKVFWVDCPAPATSGGTTGTPGSTTGTPGTTTTGGTTGSTTAGGTTGTTTTGGTTTGGTDGATGSTTGTPGATATGGTTSGTTTGGTTTGTTGAATTGSTNGGSSGGNLAETGASVIGLSGLAALMLAIGGLAMFRLRKRQH